jgi:sugar (pentulose or hexulose) kinase
MTQLALGIDIGTSGVRTAVLDAAGNVVSMARADHLPQGPAVNANHWWTAVATCLSAQVAALRDGGIDPCAISRIGVDGTSGSLVLTDAALRPVTRALMYNSTGFEAEAARIAAHAPSPHITRGPGSVLARALRLMAEDGENRARHLLHQADFIAARLMGLGGWSDENNALKTGYDPETGGWPDWLGALGLAPGLMPRVVPAGVALRPLAADIAAQFGLSPAAMVHAGTTDSIAAFLAAAPITPGVGVTSLGTTLAVKLLSDRRIDAPELGLYSHKLGTGWLVGGASNSGGGALLQHFTAAQITALSRQIDPRQASPLDYYPLPGLGERFPINDPALPARITPRPADDAAFLHGLLEGIARIERQCYRVMQDHGAPLPRQILTAGGGAQNPTWTAIRARVLGVPLARAENSDAAVGTARLIQSATGQGTAPRATA